jgi:IS66 Orf2 like protein
MVLWAKRLERGRFVWSQAKDDVVSLTPAQLAMPTEGIDLVGWRESINQVFTMPDDTSDLPDDIDAPRAMVQGHRA